MVRAADEPTSGGEPETTGDAGSGPDPDGGADSSAEPDDGDGDAPGDSGTDSAADDTLTNDGCGCQTTRDAGGPALTWLLIFGAVRARRRRRAKRDCPRRDRL